MNLRELARAATAVENGAPLPNGLADGHGLVIGVTGPPGAGKSSLVDALIAALRGRGKTVAVVAVDPSSRASGGAILGDRIRMQRHHADSGVFIRSMATRGVSGGLARSSVGLAHLFRGAGFDFTILETVGVGQDEIDIAGHADVTVVVLVPGMGDDVQAIKAGIMEVADIFVINKADRPGVEQTQREIESMLSLGHEAVPIFRTVAIDGVGIEELTDALQARKRKVPSATGKSVCSIDHLGIAVRSIEDALSFYAGQLGLEVASRETVEHEKVRLAMLPVGESRIELLEDWNGDSTIAKFIEKRGPGLHHVALRVPDLNAVIARLESAGVRLLSPPQTGAGGHTY
ncbi:MAG: GTPase, partial [Bryobacterales bacterium]|nr:GTPase [Bryobacterales bacterium]